MTGQASPTNVQEFTVSELSGALKRVVEDRFSFVRLRGEISGYRGPHSSGHAYFSIKDQNAKIDAVIWKGVFGRMRIRPEEGLEVVASGKVTTFPGKSTYQLVVESLELAGVGALMAQLDERRRRLAAEGLFAEARKRPLPFLPKVIGIVTSPTGAVIRDILHRLSERFPLTVLVWPVRVQGETSAGEVAAAIKGFNDLPADGPISRPEVLIVARGGGSLEDLWGFNEESVVRAAAAGAIPLISAVGHETDWTLIDHIADRRAPTPTAAAEMATPVLSDLRVTLGDLARRLEGASARLIDRRRADLRALLRALPAGDALLASLQQRVDMAASRLAGSARSSMNLRALRIGRFAARLAAHSPQASLARDRAQFQSLRKRLVNCCGVVLERKSEVLRQIFHRFANARIAQVAWAGKSVDAQRWRLASLAARLPAACFLSIERRRVMLDAHDKLRRSLGYTNVLTRGFALVRDSSGHSVRRAADIKGQVSLDLEFADGHVAVNAESAAAPRGKGLRRPFAIRGQGTLF